MSDAPDDWDACVRKAKFILVGEYPNVHGTLMDLAHVILALDKRLRELENKSGEGT